MKLSGISDKGFTRLVKKAQEEEGAKEKLIESAEPYLDEALDILYANMSFDGVIAVHRLITFVTGF